MTDTPSKRDAELERRLAAANDRIRSLEELLAAQREAYELLDQLTLKINAERVAFRSLIEEIVFFAGTLPKDFLTRARAALERFTQPEENA